MSKYSKKLAQKAYRKQTRENNKMWAAKRDRIKEESRVDKRSTYQTFLKWLQSNAPEGLFIYEGILSIWGSDGIRVTEEHVGRAPYNKPDFVDYELEGYYEVHADEDLPYPGPMMKYADWFYNVYLKN